MANRIGIELVPSVCRVVVVDSQSGLFRRRSSGSGRVVAFHEVPYHAASPGQLAEELRRLGLRGHASVAVWGLRGEHRVLSLPPAETADLEALARREAGVSAGGADVSDALMVGDDLDGGLRQVTYVSVPVADVRSAIRPLTDAGLDVAGVVTPAQAHAHLVRQRVGVGSGTATAVLAVQGRTTGITVVKGGAVLFARELPWGHESDRAIAGPAPADGGEFVARLASELRRTVVYLKQQHRTDVSQVLLCGDVSDLRALTGPLMHDLNLDVETLDSPDGFDLSRLPEPADEFRSRFGAFRTAWTLAGGEAPTVNLLPRGGTTVRPRVTARHTTQVWRAAAAGLIIALLAWGAIELLGRTDRGRIASLRRDIAALEPEVQRIDAIRLARTTDAARAAALEAFASEGPRLARLLEALGQATPPEVAVSSLALVPGPGIWRVTVKGQALAPTPAEAQAAFSRFAKALGASEHMGVAFQAPEISMRVEEPDPETKVALDRDSLEPGRTTVPRPATVGFWEPLPPGAKPTRQSLRDGARLGEAGNERIRVQNGIVYQWVERRIAPEQQRDLTPRTESEAAVREAAKYAGAVLDFTLHYEVRK